MAEQEGASSAATLEGILGEGQPLGEPAQSTTPGAGAEATAVEHEPEVVEGEQPVEGTEVAEEQVAEETPGEEELAPTEDEVDYSDAVYTRFAQHFQKTHNLEQPLDINNPVTRLMLHEIIQRGENFRRLQATQAAPEEVAPEETTEEVATEETSQQETPEQVQQFLTEVDKFAESRVRPEIASKFAKDFMTALWGDKGAEIAKKMAPEAAKNFTKTMTSFGYLFLNDALPSILESYIPGLMSRAYPGFDQVQNDAVNEAAYEQLAGAKDRTGNALYPDLEELVFSDNSPLEEVYASHPELKTMRFADQQGRLLPPVQQEQRRLEMAIAYARGQAPAPELLRGAAEAGRQQAVRAQKAASAGRLAPGESGGTFERQGDEADELMKGMNQFGDRDRAIQDLLAPKQR